MILKSFRVLSLDVRLQRLAQTESNSRFTAEVSQSRVVTEDVIIVR